MKRAPLKFFVVGTPIGHSLSPIMHNAAFETVHADASFGIFDPQSVEGFLLWCNDVAHQSNGGVRVGGFCVTIPYKQEAFKRCETLSTAAHFIGAVNTVTRQESGELKGDNTDCIGFARALSYELEKGKRPSLSSASTALVIGTGGVARAIVYALIDAGIRSVTVSSRYLENARAFVDSFEKISEERNVELIACQNVTDKTVRAYNVVVNATPLGLCDDDPLPASVKWLESTGAFLFDAVYRKEHETRFVMEARKAGLTACDGRRMLVEQGIAAQDIWNKAFLFWNNENDRSLVQRAMFESILEQEKGE